MLPTTTPGQFQHAHHAYPSIRTTTRRDTSMLWHLCSQPMASQPTSLWTPVCLQWVSYSRPPPMIHFLMPGSRTRSSQAESAMTHPTPAQPDTARTTAIATLFNLRPRWELGATLTSSNSLLTQTRLSKAKNAWLWARLLCISYRLPKMSCLISLGLH